MENFPPNSRKEQARHEPRQRVEQVTSSARRRRKPLGKQFKATFFSGDARTAGEYMIFEVLIPMAKDALVESVTSGFERLVLGERGPRRSRPGFMNPMTMMRTNYGDISRQQITSQPSLPRISRQARARHDFGEIVFTSRQDAEEVLDRLQDLIAHHGEATVADLYSLSGIETSHVDVKWGWTDLQRASFGRIRGGGYVLQLPEPEALR